MCTKWIFFLKLEGAAYIQVWFIVRNLWYVCFEKIYLHEITTGTDFNKQSEISEKYADCYQQLLFEQAISVLQIVQITVPWGLCSKNHPYTVCVLMYDT